MSQEEQPFRALGHLAMLVFQAGQKGLVSLDDYTFGWIEKGRGACEQLFELATEAELGEAAEKEDAEALLRILPAETVLVLIDIAGGYVARMTAGEALVKDEANMVGAAFLAEKEPEWIFWRPVSYPLAEARILFLPRWISPSKGP